MHPRLEIGGVPGIRQGNDYPDAIELGKPGGQGLQHHRFPRRKLSCLETLQSKDGSKRDLLFAWVRQSQLEKAINITFSYEQTVNRYRFYQDENLNSVEQIYC